MNESGNVADPDFEIDLTQYLIDCDVNCDSAGGLSFVAGRWTNRFLCVIVVVVSITAFQMYEGDSRKDYS